MTSQLLRILEVVASAATAASLIYFCLCLWAAATTEGMPHDNRRRDPRRAPSLVQEPQAILNAIAADTRRAAMTRKVERYRAAPRVNR